jgi:hypothetical protein
MKHKSEENLIKDYNYKLSQQTHCANTNAEALPCAVINMGLHPNPSMFSYVWCGFSFFVFGASEFVYSHFCD